MEYYISANNEYVKATLSKLKIELTKAVKEACGLVFTKGKYSNYRVDIWFLEGSFSAEIKSLKDDSIFFEIKYIEIEPDIYISNLEQVIGMYNDKINSVKEFILQLKKLK